MPNPPPVCVERDIRKLVQGGAAVISLLPAHLHAKVARLCIDVRTDMITASYVSPELAKLHTAAQEAGQWGNMERASERLPLTAIVV